MKKRQGCYPAGPGPGPGLGPGADSGRGHGPDPDSAHMAVAEESSRSARRHPSSHWTSPPLAADLLCQLSLPLVSLHSPHPTSTTS